jgi:hypothetical protein
MADVHFICMRDASARVERLARLMEARGWSIGGPPDNDLIALGAAAGLVVWSDAAIRSRPFLTAAQRLAGKGLILRLVDAPLPDSLRFWPAIDLLDWTSEPDDLALAPVLTGIADIMSNAAAAAGLHAQVRYWRVLDVSDEAALRGYLDQFGEDGFFADLANHRLAKLAQARPRASLAADHAGTRPPASRDWSGLRSVGVMTALTGAAVAALLLFSPNTAREPPMLAPSAAYAQEEPAPVTSPVSALAPPSAALPSPAVRAPAPFTPVVPKVTASVTALSWEALPLTPLADAPEFPATPAPPLAAAGAKDDGAPA